MKGWEIASQYVEDLRDQYTRENPDYVHACLSGTLSANLSSIFIDLSICYPEAYEYIIRNFKRKGELNHVSN